MVWARLKVVDISGQAIKGADGKPEERLFNLKQLQWWIGRGDHRTELQFAGQPPVYVAIGHHQIERLTGAGGGYASGD